MADVTYKGTNIPTQIAGDTSGIEEANNQSKLFEGILKTSNTVIQVGDNVANVLIKQKEQKDKENVFKDNLRGKKSLTEFAYSLNGMTATEKESEINSKYSEIYSSDETEAYKKGFTSNLQGLYEKVLSERVLEDQNNANNALYNQVQTDMKFQSLSPEYINSKVDEMSEILPHINKTEASLNIIKGYTDSLYEGFNINSSKISKFNINSLKQNSETGGFVIENSSVNIETPISLEELNSLKQNDLENLNNFINSNRYSNSNNKNMKKELNNLRENLSSKYKSKIDEVVEYSKNFLFNVRGGGNKTFDSYSISPSEMEETFKNASYSNGKIDTIQYKKLKNEYEKNYNKRNSELKVIYNVEENIANGKIINKTDNPFAFDFYKKKANSDFMKSISNKDISFIAKYQNSTYLIKDDLSKIVKQIGSSKNSKVDFVQQYDYIKLLESNSTTNNMLKNNIKPKDMLILKSKQLLVELGVNDESFSKISSNIDFQEGSIDKKQRKNLIEKFGLDKYSPEVRDQFVSIALVFENEYKSDEFQELISDYEKENTEEIAGVTLKTHNSNFIIKGSGLNEEENINEAEDEIIKSISNDIKKDYGLSTSEFTLKPLPMNKEGYSNLILIDKKGNELKTYKTKNYYEDYKYVKSHPGKLTKLQSALEIPGSVGEGILNSVTEGLVEIGDGFVNLWNGIKQLHSYSQKSTRKKSYREKQINKVETVYKTFKKIYKDDVFDLGIFEEMDIVFSEGTDYSERTYNFISNKINDYNYINKKVLEKRKEEKSMHNNVRSFKELEREVRQENEQMLLNLKVSLKAINEL